MTDDHHRIESFRFCISNPDDISPQEMQDKISYIFKHHIHPELSPLLTQCSGNKLVTLDTLEINLGELDFDNLQQQLPDRILEALRQQILTSIRENPSLRQDSPTRSLQILIHLLKYGSTPWWAPQASSRSFRYWIQTALQEAPQQLLDFLSENLQYNHIHSRLLNNVTPDIHSQLTQLVSNTDAKTYNEKLLEFLRQPQSPTHTTPLDHLQQFLQQPPSSSATDHFTNLLQQATSESSTEHIHRLIHSTLQSSHRRQQLIQRLPNSSLSSLIKHLSPSEHQSIWVQTNAILSLVQQHFADKPHLAHQLKIRLWDLSITRFLDTSSSSNHAQALIKLLQQEQYLSTSELLNSAKHFLTQQNNLPYNIKQQISSFINTPPSSLNINKLFQHLEKQSSTPTDPTALIHALRQKTQPQLRQILSQKSYLTIILNAPDFVCIELLSLLHPDPTPVIQHLEPLKNETFPGHPWTGKQIYHSMIESLIAKPPLPSSTSLNTKLNKLSQQTASQLNIPIKTWQKLILPILTSTHTEPSSPPLKTSPLKKTETASDFEMSSHSPSNHEVDQQGMQAMPDLWAAMLEKLWDTDPIATIQQIRNAALSGPQSITHYQAIPTLLIHKLIEALHPDFPSSLTDLLNDLHTLHTHQLLPGLSAKQNLNTLLAPTLILSLSSAHILHQTPLSLTKVLLQTLAQHNKTPLHGYLQQLHRNIQSAPNDRQPQSSLASYIQSFITPITQNHQITAGTIKTADPLLIQQLQTQITERVPSITPATSSPQKSTTELETSIFEECLNLLPSLWPHYTQPDKIIDSALHNLNFNQTNTNFKDLTLHLQHIHALLTAETPIPEDTTLLNSLTILTKKSPHSVIPLIAKHIHEPSFLNRLQARSPKLQAHILHLLAPEPTYLLKALISKIEDLPSKTLWKRATHTVSQLYPNKLDPKATILHFLSQGPHPPEQQALQLLKIQPSRHNSSDARLNLLLHHIATENNNLESNYHSIKKTWPNFEVARTVATTRLKQEKPHFNPIEIDHIIELAPIAPTHRSLLQDISSTFTAIALRQQQTPDLTKLITPLLQESIPESQKLLSQLINSAASQYQTSLSNFIEDHWPLIQELSATYQNPSTLTTLHQSITALIPEREIPLPQLPGSSQTVFETTPPDTSPTSITSTIQNTPSKHTMTEEPPPLISDDIDREVWLVENAGLVIFTPYIEILFERSNLLEHNNLTNATRAAFLLHYLVTGQNEAEEHQLLLNKVLCNIPLDQALPLSVTPEDNWSELTSGLITAVIQHWNTLGEASPESLLSTFVKREGSLRYDQEEGWSLHIPEGPYDMLLTSLPWAISTVNLPWMNEPLRVEWK